jgi:hypothetical protein
MFLSFEKYYLASQEFAELFDLEIGRTISDRNERASEKFMIRQKSPTNTKHEAKSI